jgi:hypothetical protein
MTKRRALKVTVVDRQHHSAAGCRSAQRPIGSGSPLEGTLADLDQLC